MNFAVAAGCHSSRAAPFLPDTPAATYYTTTRQRLHLSTAKRCADKAGHLNDPPPRRMLLNDEQDGGRFCAPLATEDRLGAVPYHVRAVRRFRGERPLVRSRGAILRRPDPSRRTSRARAGGQRYPRCFCNET